MVVPQYLLGFWVIPVNLCLITCDHLQKELWVFVKSSIGTSWIVLTPFSFYSLHSGSRTQVWWQSDTSADCLSECCELIQMRFLHVSCFRDADSSVFKDNSHYLINIFICFCSSVDIPSIQHLKQMSHLFMS